MFDDGLIVSSAASAFNNIAVVAPAFLWNAVLCLPLFVGIYIVGRYFADRLGILPYITRARAVFWTVVLTAIWVVLIGGNYDVLRDGHSLLPWVTAAILFVSSIFVGINTRALKLPIWYGKGTVSLRLRWLMNVLVFVILMVPVGLSDTLNWWGPILQICAIILGLVIGRFSGRQMRAVSCVLGVMFAATIAVLMQPELFRFGQLGNLTPGHLVWFLVVGVLIATAFMVDVVNPRGRVHQSAYVKLKWLFRFVVLLCAVLFALTEAVPIFIATVAFVGISVALSVWHSTELPDKIQEILLSWAIICFGVLISVPTITAIGILLLGATRANVPGGCNMRFLL
ncbi:MAG: hypothetical protein J6T57_00550 [Alphaproteobacteria bacterium]|nr:hypothetical protein [Alphaproteobacteria bacterium]